MDVVLGDEYIAKIRSLRGVCKANVFEVPRGDFAKRIVDASSDKE